MRNGVEWNKLSIPMRVCGPWVVPYDQPRSRHRVREWYRNTLHARKPRWKRKLVNGRWRVRA